MDRDMLNELYQSNKADIIIQEEIVKTIERLKNTLESKSSIENTSNYLYKLLCEYFMVSEDNIELCDIISNATSSREYLSLKELEDKINDIRKGE